MSQRYLLIDGARYQAALPRLYRRDEPLEIEPLYFDTIWHGSADVGPLLVQASSSSTLFSEVATDPELRASAAIVSSPAPLHAVAEHLRQFNQVTDTTGGNSLLRYADPLVAWFWLQSSDTRALNNILGPLTTWALLEPTAVWQPPAAARWRTFHRLATHEERSDPPIRLSATQTDALENAYRWQLQERLYHWLQASRHAELAHLTPDDWGAWLTERLAEAASHCLTTERSLAVWCDLSALQGDDFAAQPEGAYQRWLARMSAQAPHTPDQRLQQYYLSVAGDRAA